MSRRLLFTLAVVVGFVAAAQALGSRAVGPETIRVPANSASPVTTKTVLRADHRYRLVVTGTVSDWCPATAKSAADCTGSPLEVGRGVDAVWCYAAWRCSTPQAWQQLSINGRGILDFAGLDATDLPYTPTHRYTIEFKGVDGKLSLGQADALGGSAADNSGAYTVTITDLGPAAPTVVTFNFRTYTNNVRILPPLVGDWQLGISRITGSGTLTPRDGRVGGGFSDTFHPRIPKYRPGTLDAVIVSATYSTVGKAKRVYAQIRIVGSSNTKNCPLGSVGRLDIWDDPAKIANGHSGDRVFVGSWPNACGFVQGFSNADSALTQPANHGGPGGGNWAEVTITTR